MTRVAFAQRTARRGRGSYERFIQVTCINAIKAIPDMARIQSLPPRLEGSGVPAEMAAADGSCIRLRPERPNHVWAYDFVEDRTSEGMRYRMLNIVDEFTREVSGDPGRAQAHSDGRDRDIGRSIPA